MAKSLHQKYIPYAHHYKPWLVYVFPIFKDHFFVFKEVFSENSVLMYGLYSRAAYDGARTVIESTNLVLKYKHWVHPPRLPIYHNPVGP